MGTAVGLGLRILLRLAGFMHLLGDSGQVWDVSTNKVAFGVVVGPGVDVVASIRLGGSGLPLPIGFGRCAELSVSLPRLVAKPDGFAPLESLESASQSTALAAV